MELQTTKNKIITLVEESKSEFLLEEVYRILEMGSSDSFQLTEEEMNEMDKAEKKFDKGEGAASSWNEIRSRLIGKLKG
jgi:hypothetical protein